MANENEEIIIIEEEPSSETLQSNDETIVGQKNKRKLTLVIATISVVLLAIILTLFLSSDETAEPEPLFDSLQNVVTQKKNEVVSVSSLETMIAKANYLYEQGEKQHALNLYSQIAHYSQAISQYNLGVAQMKEAHYSSAIDAFKRAIENNQSQCPSAINAAVCALYLEDDTKFNYYITLAEAFLPYSQQQQLYTYYYSLIHFYKQEYLNVLGANSFDKLDYRKRAQARMYAKVALQLGDTKTALHAMEIEGDDRSTFTKALLYASISDLSLAQTYLQEAILQSEKPLQEQLALVYVYLKMGEVSQAQTLLTDITDLYGEEIYKPFPITVTLKQTFFETEHAQVYYRNVALKEPRNYYQRIFHYAPYKIFNANKTISYIKKGTANISIDNLQSASTYLKQSSIQSIENKNIALGVSLALKSELISANTIFKNIEKIYRHNPILQYNLALSYAQLGNFQKAHYHFLQAYHLDAGNYSAGIYALFCSEILGETSKKLYAIIKENLSDEQPSNERDFYQALLNIYDKNFISAVEWLEQKTDISPITLYSKVLIAQMIDNTTVAQTFAQQLQALLPDELLSNIILCDQQFARDEPKIYAAHLIEYFKSHPINMNTLLKGDYISRFTYAQLGLMNGKIYEYLADVKDILQHSTASEINALQQLALLELFSKSFEEAYVLYNELIDNYKQRDAQTLFIGAIASIGAGHHANAIALLELSKLKNKHFAQSRYALALLYLEAKNNHGATIALANINAEHFNSAFFNFDIDTNATFKQLKGIK